MTDDAGCQCRDDALVIGGGFGGKILEVTHDAEGGKVLTYLCNDCGLPGVVPVVSWAGVLKELGYDAERGAGNAG